MKVMLDVFSYDCQRMDAVEDIEFPETSHKHRSHHVGAFRYWISKL